MEVERIGNTQIIRMEETEISQRAIGLLLSVKILFKCDNFFIVKYFIWTLFKNLHTKSKSTY